MTTSRDRTIRYGLKLSDPDGVEKWRADAEEREREQRREQRRERRADRIEQLSAELRTEVASLRAEMAERQELTHEAVGEVLGEFSASAENCTERAIKQIQNEFWTALEQRFAALNARLDLMERGGGKARAEKFRQSSAVQDLPNPLGSRRGGLN